MGTALINRWQPINIVNPTVNIARVYLYNYNTLYYQITNHELYWQLGINSIVSFTQMPPVALIQALNQKIIFDAFIREFYN